ncbi:unnamed protein product [Nippostrongylus brasiliensis]|uniref:Prothymosin alpha-like n=1 Tax=Nippostrongylus brasiliensis TaxID=27835 RepID=A0A0N4XMZ0_NIPBR|nr:unnamed protein product [Nippostrongylus brasiliensis]
MVEMEDEDEPGEQQVEDVEDDEDEEKEMGVDRKQEKEVEMCKERKKVLEKEGTRRLDRDNPAEERFQDHVFRFYSWIISV